MGRRLDCLERLGQTWELAVWSTVGLKMGSLREAGSGCSLFTLRYRQASYYLPGKKENRKKERQEIHLG